MRSYALIAAWIFAGLGLVWASPAQAQDRDDIPADDLERLLDELDEELDDLRDEFEHRLERLRERFGGRLRDLLDRAPRPAEGTGEAWLGVSLAEVDEETRTLLDIPSERGVLITEVHAESPAKAALQTFDIILTVDGEDVSAPAQVTQVVKQRDPGDVLQMQILREGESRDVRVTLGERGVERQPRPSPPGTLREFLDRAYEEGDRPDPEAPAPGGGLGDLLDGFDGFDGLDDLFDPEGGGLQDLLDQFMDPDGEGGGLGDLLDELMNPDGENGGGLGDLLDELMNPDGEGGGLGDLLEELFPQPNGENGGGLGDLLEELFPQPNGDNGGGLGDFFEELFPQPEPEAGPEPYLGLSASDLSPEQRREGIRGVVLDAVVAGGPAANAGLQAGDILTRMNDQDIRALEDVRTVLLELEPGDEVTVVVLRDGERVEMNLVVGQR